MDVILIAAIAENGVIGRGNALPWRLKSDMAHFRNVTMGKPVVMGRKTYQSIGKQLPGRTTIVVSRDRGFAAPGIVVAPSLDAALTTARGDALRRGADAIVVAGGAEIYRQVMGQDMGQDMGQGMEQGMGQATRLVLTQVHLAAEGDAHFPAIEPGRWRETARSEHDAGAGDDAAFTIVHYQRVVRGGSAAGA